MDHKDYKREWTRTPAASRHDRRSVATKFQQYDCLNKLNIKILLADMLTRIRNFYKVQPFGKVRKERKWKTIGGQCLLREKQCPPEK